MSSKILMTNKEAAKELKEIKDWLSIIPRGSAKSHIPRLLKLMALEKAIELLEKPLTNVGANKTQPIMKYSTKL